MQSTSTIHLGGGARTYHQPDPDAASRRPEELAELIAWLASDKLSFSTGAVYDISGGRATH